jgi:hypothetical protein
MGKHQVSGERIWLVILALALFSFLFNESNNKYRTRIWRTVRFPGSSGWPLVPATVEQVIVRPFSRAISVANLLDRISYRAEISYSYSVDGEYYSGWYEDVVWSKVEADDFVAQYPKGTTIQVHVSPAKPELSVLQL